MSAFKLVVMCALFFIWGIVFMTFWLRPMPIEILYIEHMRNKKELEACQKKHLPVTKHFKGFDVMAVPTE